MLNLTNKYRTDQCMEALKEHRSLVRAAQAQADMMCLYNRFMGKNEKELSNNLLKYDYVGQNIGENTAREQGDDYKEVFRIWKEHSDYNKNLLGDFENIGIGTCTSEDAKRYWVQLFGKKLKRNKEMVNESEKPNDRIILVLNSKDKKQKSDSEDSIGVDDKAQTITLDTDFMSSNNNKRSKSIDDIILTLGNAKSHEKSSCGDVESMTNKERTCKTNDRSKSSMTEHENTTNLNSDTSMNNESDISKNSSTDTKSSTKSRTVTDSSSSTFDVASLISEGFKNLQSSIFNNFKSITNDKDLSSIDISSLQGQIMDVMSCMSSTADATNTSKPISQTISTSQISSKSLQPDEATEGLDLLKDYTKPFSSFIDEVTDSVASNITTTIYVTSSKDKNNIKSQKSTYPVSSSMFDELTSELSLSNDDNSIFDTKSFESLKTDDLFISKVSSMLYDTQYLKSIKDLCKDRTSCSSFFASQFIKSDSVDPDMSRSNVDLPITSSSMSNEKQDISTSEYDATSSKKTNDNSTYDKSSKTTAMSSQDITESDTKSISSCQAEIDKNREKRHTQLIIADIEGRIVNYGDNKISNVVDKRNIKNNKNEQIEKTIDDLRKILNSRNIYDRNIKIIVADDKCDAEANAEVGNAVHLGD
ncbi:hypothetical protein BDAP_001977 [Binucleata daphniae]